MSFKLKKKLETGSGIPIDQGREKKKGLSYNSKIILKNTIYSWVRKFVLGRNNSAECHKRVDYELIVK